MIYKEWSNEFGVRLQEITGISWMYFKELYEYKNKVIPDETKYFIVDDTFIAPIVELIDRYTKERIPTLLGDASLNQIDLILNQDSCMFEKYNFKIIQNARQDYIVPLTNNFKEHLKNIPRISRCYNKCSSSFNVLFSKGMILEERHRELLNNYSEYWINKGEEPMYFELFKSFITQVKLISSCYTIEVSDCDGKTLALAYFEITNNEVYWHETIRVVDESYKKYSIGNYILLQALETICYPLNLPLNLGVSWFDYKQHWHPEIKEVRGLEFIDKNRRIE